MINFETGSSPESSVRSLNEGEFWIELKYLRITSLHVGADLWKYGKNLWNLFMQRLFEFIQSHLDAPDISDERWNVFVELACAQVGMIRTRSEQAGGIHVKHGIEHTIKFWRAEDALTYIRHAENGLKRHQMHLLGQLGQAIEGTEQRPEFQEKFTIP